MATPTMNRSDLTALQACPAEVQEILHAVGSGAELTFGQGLLLATAEGLALDALVAVADQLRRETVGDVITFVVNRNINFTNVCLVRWWWSGAVGVGKWLFLVRGGCRTAWVDGGRGGIGL